MSCVVFVTFAGMVTMMTSFGYEMIRGILDESGPAGKWTVTNL